MTKAALLAALETCHAQQGPNRPNFSVIAKQHHIDRHTLRRQYDKTLQPHLQPEDHRSLLSREQEGVLLDHLDRLGKRHLFITPMILRNLVNEITGHQPGESWARQFVKKHKDRVKCMVVGGMEASRHSAEYRPVFEAYFDLLEQKCRDLNIGPDSIYNMDEKGFMMGRTNKQRRIVPVAQASEPGGTQSRMDGSREWVSLLACICANGTALTPSIIFSGKQVGEGWMAELSEEERYWVAVSEKGWTTEELGLQWLEEVFHPATQANRRRLLIMDGHGSHVNSNFIQRCNSLRITLLILPPHSTHRLQPLDVGLFSPLSTAYTTIFDQQWQATEGRLFVNKARFFSILLQAWKRSVTPDNIRNAFSKAGIFPHNRAIVVDRVFQPPALPRTPSPAPTDMAVIPSSPLGEGKSGELLRKVKRNKKKASHAVVKMAKRIVGLEAAYKLSEANSASLRESVKKARNKKAFKPIVPGHEERMALWIGPEEVEAHRRRIIEEALAREEEEREKRTRKEATAAKRAEREALKGERTVRREALAAQRAEKEAERALKAKERTEKEKWKADFIAARPARIQAAQEAQALGELDLNQAGPSNWTREHVQQPRV